MLRSWLAAHARKTALVLAFLCATAFLSIAATWIVSVEWRRTSENLSAAVQRTKDVRDTVVDSLRHLNKSMEPTCSDENLSELRRLQFRSRYLGDIGIFDAEFRLLCTAVAGIAAVPITVPPPDLIQRSAQGDLFLSNFDASPLAIGGRERSTIVQLGRFNVVVSPFAVRDILGTGISAVQQVPPSGQIRTVVRQESLGLEWPKKLRTAELSVGGLRRPLWNEGAFIVTEAVPGTTYVVQSVVLLDTVIRDGGKFFVSCLIVAVLIGVLVYQLSKIRFLRWRDLRYSIEHLLDDKHLLCVYQPIVELQTLKTVGCEVLMRLRDGDKLIPPDQVIPAIIARNLTWRLDQLVVKRAIAELTEHLPRLEDFNVAINFFPGNVTVEKISQLFKEALPEEAQGSLHFEVEVLEQEYVENQVVKEVTKLRQLGFLFSVDDFGTGYSNLGSIKAISPDFLKIDRSFVVDMEDSSIRSSLIPEIIAIARAVGAQVIAEGIENERQLLMLRSMGVEFGQGFYFSKPKPIADFVSHLETSPPS